MRKNICSRKCQDIARYWKKCYIDVLFGHHCFMVVFSNVSWRFYVIAVCQDFDADCFAIKGNICLNLSCKKHKTPHIVNLLTKILLEYINIDGYLHHRMVLWYLHNVMTTVFEFKKEPKNVSVSTKWIDNVDLSSTDFITCRNFPWRKL